MFDHDVPLRKIEIRPLLPYYIFVGRLLLQFFNFGCACACTIFKLYEHVMEQFNNLRKRYHNFRLYVF